MNTVQSRARAYYERFNELESIVDRQALAAEYKEYYAQLSEADKVIADEVTKPYLANAVLMVQEMEPILERAKEMLDRIHPQTA